MSDPKFVMFTGGSRDGGVYDLNEGDVLPEEDCTITREYTETRFVLV